MERIPPATERIEPWPADRPIATLLDLLERAVARYGERDSFGLRREDGTSWHWTYSELLRRSRYATWRLGSLGLQPGDRILTWSGSTPALVAAYFGAMRARLIYVPLDLRMSQTAIEGIVRRSGATHLILGTGRDAPDPAEAGLDGFPTTLVDDLVAEPDEAFPPDWEARLDARERPRADDVYELVFTSGTTGTPKGVTLAHGSAIASVEGIHRVIPRMEHRLVSLLPLSHLYEQLVGTFYTIDVGADTLYVRSRTPRVIAAAIREHRTTSMITVPQGLDLLWDGLAAEIRKSGRQRTFDRLRAIARLLPFGMRRALFGSVHRQFLGTDFRIFVSIGSYLPPALQLAWEELGIVVLQGYGSTETAFGAANRLGNRGLGTVGWSVPPFELRIAPDGEVLFRGPSLFKGYWNDPDATARVFDADGWYHTGDAGHFDAKGRLILDGRTRDMIVLPNGFNVFPEDIENELRNAGIRDSVVLETRPGRIEAVVIAPDRPQYPSNLIPSTAPAGLADVPDELRARIDASVKAANAKLGINQRIDGWRLWPAADFPRTHTLKVKRDQVKAWVAFEGGGPGPSADDGPNASSGTAGPSAPAAAGAVAGSEAGASAATSSGPGPLCRASRGRPRRRPRADREPPGNG